MQPWEGPVSVSNKPAGCPLCGAKHAVQGPGTPDTIATFEQVGSPILARYGKYIAPSKKQPGYLGKHAHVLHDADFRKAVTEKVLADHSATYQRDLATVETERSKALAEANHAPLSSRAAAVAGVQKDYDKLRKMFTDVDSLYRSQLATNAQLMSGHVSDDQELYVNADKPGFEGTEHHEAIHMYDSPEWGKRIDLEHRGGPLNEAVTQYFTQQVGYPEAPDSNLKPAYVEGSQLVRQRYSEDALARAYFQGDFSKMDSEYPVDRSVNDFNRLFPLNND